MLRNYLAAALRNMVRNRLYAAINILGLAAGFAAVLIIGLFIRDELTFERWMPGAESTFTITSEIRFTNGNPTVFADMSPSRLMETLTPAVPGIESAARLYNAPRAREPLAGIRRGDVEADERLYWADPSILSTLPLPMIAGDAAALERPDGVVIARRMARKYFGRDDPIGETLEMDRQQTLTVTAVIEDLPSNTHLNFDLLGSALAPFSDFAPFAKRPGDVFTYFRLKPGVDARVLRDALPAAFASIGTSDRLRFQEEHGVFQSYAVTGISELHLSPGSATWIQKPRGNPQTPRSLGLVALCLILLACINFASLTTARAAQRAVEVGVRKTSGAARSDLALQFIGESLLTTVIAMIAAVGAVALMAPHLNAFLGRDSMSFSIVTDAPLATSIVSMTFLVGLLAGLYPALVLPAFKAASVLKGSATGGAGASRLRQSVVVIQFAVLIALILTSAIVYRQTQFAFDEGMRLDTAQVLVARTNCSTAFKDEVAKIPGVAAAACSSNMALNYEWGQYDTKRADGTVVPIDSAIVDIGFLELYGVQPVVGRFFQRDNAMDTSDAPRTLVVNETAVRSLGYASNDAALGQFVEWIGPYGNNGFQQGPYQIVGVTPDVWLDAVHETVRPVAYGTLKTGYQLLSIKLKGQDIPETLTAIERAWAAAGEPKPLTRFFLDQRVQELYVDITRQSQFFTALAATAIVIAMLGLFALSAFTAEQRTKEIGIRKSMGADRRDILGLLLWQFAKPVLWANLIAWPAAYLLMKRWLEGFAYHVELAPWMFLAASGLALTIALATVIGHALLVARARPVAALRYE
ncbi:MAG: FtsX-like permease family protein [Rhodospirillaceae bacterium]